MSKTIVKFLMGLLLTMVLNSAALANQILENSWQFIETAGASAEDNQQFITQSNQFSAEADFTANEYAELLLIRAIIYSRLKDTENALENYSATLDSKLLPPILKAEALKNRGLLYYESTVYKEAKDDFFGALEILSGNAELHYYLANAYFGLFDFKTAITQYDLALEGMSNNRFLAYYGKASVFHQQELFDKSRENLQKSLEVNPNFEPALTLLAELNGANVDGIEQNSAGDQPVSGELTAAEIYNQLLEKAFAAQKAGGGTKNISIKLDLESLPTKKSDTSSAIRISALPQNDLIKTFNGQVSVIPFIIEQDGKSNRLDSLLLANTKPQSDEYFLQLFADKNEDIVQKYYDKVMSKHKLLLGKRPYSIEPFVNNQQETTYQLFVSGFTSYKQANSLCKFLKAQNSQCSVRQIK